MKPSTLSRGAAGWVEKIAKPPSIGDVLFVALPQHNPPGHEQTGFRPAVVSGLPDRLGQQRFPMLVVVPLTTQIGTWAREPKLYPFFVAGTGGLHYDSVALLDHLRSLDASRVARRLGHLTADQYAPIQQGLETMCKATL